MPDWLTHMGIAYVIIWGISKAPKFDSRFRKYYWLFMIGMVAPDLDRIIRMVAQLLDFTTLLNLSYSLTYITHSFLGVALISLFITAFFPREKDLKFIYLAVLVGGLGHLTADLIMYPWGGMGLFLLFPLKGSEFAFSFHLVWPGGFIPLYITAAFVLGTVIIDLIQKNFSVFNFKFGKV